MRWPPSSSAACGTATWSTSRGGAIDAWLLDLRTGPGGRLTTAKVIVAYVALQLAAFAALRSFAGPGRFDVAAAWALAYGVGYVALSFALARRPRGDAAA